MSQALSRTRLRARNARNGACRCIASREEAEAAGLLKEARGGSVRLAGLGAYRAACRLCRGVRALAGAIRRHGDQRAQIKRAPRPVCSAIFPLIPIMDATFGITPRTISTGSRQNAAGLEAKILRDRNYEYEVFSWVDSLASAITRRQNFVHRALKKGEGSPMRRLAAAFMAMCLLPLAAVAGTIEHTCGRGSTLTFVLRPVKHS